MAQTIHLILRVVTPMYVKASTAVPSYATILVGGEVSSKTWSAVSLLLCHMLTSGTKERGNDQNNSAKQCTVATTSQVV